MDEPDFLSGSCIECSKAQAFGQETKKEENSSTVPEVAYVFSAFIFYRKAHCRGGENHDVLKIGGKYSEQSNC